MHSGSAQTLCRQIQGPGIPVHRLRLLTPGDNPLDNTAGTAGAAQPQLSPAPRPGRDVPPCSSFCPRWRNGQGHSALSCSWPGMKGTHLHRIIAKGIVQDSWVTGR